MNDSDLLSEGCSIEDVSIDVSSDNSIQQHRSRTYEDTMTQSDGVFTTGGAFDFASFFFNFDVSGLNGVLDCGS